MINKRDINKLRTPEDLERKYNLSDIVSLKENYELQKSGLTKVENELNNFVIATANNLKELQDQVDGNITTWFYSGVPTDSNEPANEWTTTDEKNNHLGDLYYDKETGYAYRYSLENDVYSWIKITDNDVTKALAIANSAKDVADSKRRVFVNEPIPPYDCGDLWIKDEELYRCQTTKDENETFEENDWIIATKYTDDTVANQVGANLTILSGTVTKIRNDVDSLTTTMTNTTELVNEQGESIGTLQEKQSKTEQTVDGITFSVSSLSKKTNVLEQTISKYQAELDIYNITIPVDSERKPFENKSYLVGYKTTFEGKEVVSSISSSSSNVGITFNLNDNKITFDVLISNAINNLTNEFVIDFSYAEDDEVYSDSKKIVITLSLKGDTGATGEQGIQGPAGKDGTSTYFYVKYSANSTGNPMLDSPTADTEYMGIVSTTSPSAPTSYSEYTWSKIKGEQGTQGVAGPTGEDGKTSYLHIKWSDDGETFTANVGETIGRYQGTYTDFVEEDSTSFDDYKWVDTAIVVEGQINNLQGQIDDTNGSVSDVKTSLETTNGTIQTLEGKITDMNFNFSTKGLKIGTSTDGNNSLYDNKGIRVYNYEKLNAIFNNKGSGIDKLIVTGSAQFGYLKVLKSTKNSKKATKFFHLKALIEDLTDLEVE